MTTNQATPNRYAKQIIVAGLVGSVLATAAYLTVVAVLGGFSHLHVTIPYFLRILITYLLPVTFGAAVVGAWMFKVQIKHPDAECRCRRCGYILNGLSRPECPECGEPV